MDGCWEEEKHCSNKRMTTGTSNKMKLFRVPPVVWCFLKKWQRQTCHVIIHNRLSLSMGSRGVPAGANPSLVSGRGQGAPWTSRQLIAGPHFRSLVDLLYPLSYSRPQRQTCFFFLSMLEDGEQIPRSRVRMLCNTWIKNTIRSFSLFRIWFTGKRWSCDAQSHTWRHGRGSPFCETHGCMKDICLVFLSAL